MFIWVLATVYIGAMLMELAAGKVFTKGYPFMVSRRKNPNEFWLVYSIQAVGAVILLGMLIYRSLPK